MAAPPPAFTIRHPDYAMPDNVTPFRDYDYLSPLWDIPVAFVSSKQTVVEEWTTNQLITLEQLEEYGAYFVGDRSDMYAVSHIVYYVEGEYMPVFRKITGHDMFADCRWMRMMRKGNARRGLPSSTPPPTAFARPVCVNRPPPNSRDKLPKRIEVVINVQGVKMIPTPNPASSRNDGKYVNMDEGDNYGKEEMEVDEGEEEAEEEEEEEEVSLWDEILIEDYFSDKASSSESPGFDNK